MPKSSLRTVPVSMIRPNAVALRAVNRESEAYLGLVESIKRQGFKGAITVREKKDAESGEKFYELIDGLHRFTAAMDAGVTEINVDIGTYSDVEALESQIMANLHKVETRPAEYGRQLVRLFSANPTLSKAEVGANIGKSTSWIDKILHLNKIESDDIRGLIDEGKVTLANAFALSKLPVEEQPEYLDRAMTLPSEEFVPMVNQRVKEIRAAKRTGRDPQAAVFTPTAHMRKLAEIKEVMDDVKPLLALAKDLKIKTVEESLGLAISWVLNMDPISVEQQKAKYEAQQKERKAASEQRKKDRAARKLAAAEKAQKEAAKTAADIGITEQEKREAAEKLQKEAAEKAKKAAA